jgi:hypothetical protein
VLTVNTLVSLAYLTCLLNSMLVPTKTLKISPTRTVEISQLQFRRLIRNNGLYNLAKVRGRRVHILSARGRDVMNFPHDRNILFMISARY